MILRYGRGRGGVGVGGGGGGGILASITEDEIFESLSIVRYGLKYLNLTGIGVYDFWAKIFGPKDDNPQ